MIKYGQIFCVSFAQQKRENPFYLVYTLGTELKQKTPQL